MAAGILVSSPKYMDMARSCSCCSPKSDKPAIKLSLFFVFAGLATLIKGPVGLIIPLAVAGIFLASSRELSKVKLRLWLLGLVIFLALTLPWYLAVYWKTSGAFGQEFLLKQNLVRFFDYRQGQPPWYYIPALIAGLFPWVFFLPVGIVSGWGAFRRGDKGILLALVWLLVVFVFFSLSASKRPDYILPLYPAAALLVASTWRDMFRSGEAGRRPMAISYLFLAASVVTALAVAAGALFLYMNWAEPFLSFFDRMMRPKELLLLTSAMSGAARHSLWLFIGLAVLAGVVITPLALKGRGKVIGMAASSLGLILITLNMNFHSSFLVSTERSLRKHSTAGWPHWCLWRP